MRTWLHDNQSKSSFNWFIDILSVRNTIYYELHELGNVFNTICGDGDKTMALFFFSRCSCILEAIYGYPNTSYINSQASFWYHLIINVLHHIYWLFNLNSTYGQTTLTCNVFNWTSIYMNSCLFNLPHEEDSYQIRVLCMY